MPQLVFVSFHGLITVNSGNLSAFTDARSISLWVFLSLLTVGPRNCTREVLVYVSKGRRLCFVSCQVLGCPKVKAHDFCFATILIGGAGIWLVIYSGAWSVPWWTHGRGQSERPGQGTQPWLLYQRRLTRGRDILSWAQIRGSGEPLFREGKRCCS